MAIAIDRELAGDINNPSFDVINYCVKKHELEVPRLEMLSDYYDGKPHKLGATSVKTPHEKGESYINNAKYVTDMMVGFTVGAPISYTASKDKNIDPVLDVYDKIGIRKHDKELEKDLSVFGIANELHYLFVDEQGETIPRIACIDPRGIFLVVDDTVDRNPLFAVRVYEKRKLDDTTFYEITVYTSKRTIKYQSKTKELSDSNLLNKIAKPHYYNAVPVVEYRNNEEKQGDYEQTLSQIDAINKLQNDRLKDKDNHIKAMMILYGFSLPDEEPEKVNGNVVIEAPAQSEGGKAEFVTNTMQESEVQVLAKDLEDKFHKTAYVPNLNDEKFSGNISGEAMKYKLFGLLLVLATKIGYMEEGLMQRLRLTANILNIKGENADVEGTTIKFKPNLPINRGDIINQIRDSQEFIPLLISLGWLDDIDNPKEALEMLLQQKEKNIELTQKAMGTQSEDSHSDLEEEEDDNSDVPPKK